jgi:hypothetical protein
VARSKLVSIPGYTWDPISTTTVTMADHGEKRMAVTEAVSSRDASDLDSLDMPTWTEEEENKARWK